jgi:uncharacterized protein YqeY
MVSLSSIESDLQAALKQRNQMAADTLRSLKTRIQNEKIAQGKDLEEKDILALIRSEVKRRKEAAEAFNKGGRSEMAQKEQDELSVLEQYLPAQLSEDQVTEKVESLIQANSWTATDFGPAMGKLKAEFGDSADGAVIAKILNDRKTIPIKSSSKNNFATTAIVFLILGVILTVIRVSTSST